MPLTQGSAAFSGCGSLAVPLNGSHRVLTLAPLGLDFN